MSKKPKLCSDIKKKQLQKAIDTGKKHYLTERNTIYINVLKP